MQRRESRHRQMLNRLRKLRSNRRRRFANAGKVFSCESTSITGAPTCAHPVEAKEARAITKFIVNDQKEGCRNKHGDDVRPATLLLNFRDISRNLFRDGLRSASEISVKFVREIPVAFERDARHCSIHGPQHQDPDCRR